MLDTSVPERPFTERPIALHYGVPGVQSCPMPLKTCLERSCVLIILHFLILMNAIERLRTLGTRCEATGRLVKERMDGGRTFFLREREKYR
jgi:hypothetical protein